MLEILLMAIEEVLYDSALYLMVTVENIRRVNKLYSEQSHLFLL